MTHLATITSKRQFTIPAKLFKRARFSNGDKVLVDEKNGVLRIKKVTSLVSELAGSVSVPKHLSKISPDEAIKLAKRRRFGKVK